MSDENSRLSDSYKWDARHYDLQYNKFTEDIPFWIGQAVKSGGPVLELACGSGRITVPLAKAGIAITGLDIAEDMLERAKKKAEAEKAVIEFIRADGRNFDIGKRFRLVIVPFNSLQFICYSRDDLRSFFDCVKKHLSEDGRVIIDLINPPVKILANPPNGRAPLPAYPDPDGRGMISVVETDIRYESDAQVWKSVWHYKIGDCEIRAEELRMRLFFPQEIDAVIEYNGFAVEDKYSDYFGGKFRTESHKQIIVCQREKA